MPRWETLMNFLGKIESANMVRDLNPNAEPAQLELRVEFSECLDRSAPLARLIGTILGKDQPSLLWITEFGVWPSLENWDLFDSLRAVSGERRPLADAPGHNFGANEMNRLDFLSASRAAEWLGRIVDRTRQPTTDRNLPRFVALHSAFGGTSVANGTRGTVWAAAPDGKEITPLPAHVAHVLDAANMYASMWTSAAPTAAGV